LDRRDFIRNSAVALSTLVSAEPGEAAPSQAPDQRSAAPKTGRIELAEKEYFEGPGFVFLVYHNNDSGNRGGLQMMQNGEWLLASDLLIAGQGSRSRTSARILRREVDRDRSTAPIFGEVSGSALGFQLICRSDGARIFVNFKIDGQPDWNQIRQAALRMYLYPPAYFLKSFQGDSAAGVFPRQYGGSRVLMSGTRSLRIAQEDPANTITWERRNGTLELGDERGSSPTAWFSVTAVIEPGSSDAGLELEITPSIDPQWRRPAVIGINQVGYHPRQAKRAVLELDHREEAVGQVRLFKLTLDGEKELAKSGAPKPWGRFLYHRYATFDFTDVVTPGAYMMEYGGQTAGPFRIDRKVFDGAWQPTLEVFLPVQMCHVSVRDRNRFWHGPCHLDDALQAPAHTAHFDGYQQGERETRFADYEHIPGLDWGGWHDAGDYDLRSASITNTILYLALAQEEFKPGLNSTTVRRATREVLLHVPDREEDLLQQIEYGVEGLLASFRVAGHIFPGIIESSRDQHDVTGDTVNVTDNHVYDSSLNPDQVAGGRSGKRDDRWAFTNRHTGLQYRVAQAFAVASRVLRPTKAALADGCLASARKLWEYEQGNPPQYAPSSYLGRSGGIGEELAATVELWLTTDDRMYQERLYALLPHIRSAPPAEIGRGVGWMLARLLPKVSAPEFRSVIVEIAKEWRDAAERLEASNPYGVRFPSWVLTSTWKLDASGQGGGGGGSIQGFDCDVLMPNALRDYFYHKYLPQVFGADPVLNVVNYILGCHPANNRSQVSGVGNNSALLAYGFNRDDYTYIPGGPIPGVSFMKPEFLDLKNFPYYYNQTEYVIHGAGSYIFIVLAAQWMLEHQTEQA